MSQNFGDISGVDWREIPHENEEGDLEYEVFFKNGGEDIDRTNDNNEMVPVVTPPPLIYSDYDYENDKQTSTPARKYDVIFRGLPGFGSNSFFW